MKNCIAEKFDSRFEKLMSFYVRILHLKKNSGGVCLRKIPLKVVQLCLLARKSDMNFLSKTNRNFPSLMFEIFERTK